MKRYKVKFGVILQGRHLTPKFKEIRQMAIRAEELGFHSIFVSDHLMHPFPVEGVPMHYCHEAWTLISALAVLTEDIKLGFNVLIPTFRHPSILAKMAATLDEISNGRLIMSIGAGWFKKEYDAYGIPWDEHDERIEREKEAILVMKALWTQPIATFVGKYYSIKGAIMEPKPLQKPHPPIWVGGNSFKTIELVAELADGWFSREIPAEKLKENITFIRRNAKDRPMDFVVMLDKAPSSKSDGSVNKIEEYIDAGVTLITVPFHKTKDLDSFAHFFL